MTDAQIFDQGYRTYDGPRTGLKGALRSLIVHSIRASLGLGRKARHKVVPFLTIALAYFPVIINVGVIAIFGDELTSTDDTYRGYYDGTVRVALFLLVAFLVPQLLCNDRRTGLLGVYLASPLNRQTYLLGKGITTIVLLMLITWVPLMLVLIGYTLQGVGPDGFGEWIKTFLQISLASTVLGVFLTAIALAVASTTDRWATAMASTMGTLLASNIVTTVLVEEADLSPYIRLANLSYLPVALVHRIFGDAGDWSYTETSTAMLAIAALAWTAGCLSFVWFRYRSLLVRR